MSEPPIGAAPAPAKPTMILQIGGVRITGPMALVMIVAIIATIVTIAVKSGATRHDWPIYVSLALWFAFITYWSVAAKRAGAAQSSESRATRAVHERMLNGALLLLFIPVPGLREHLIERTSAAIAIGLGIQIASGLLGVWARRILGRNWSGAITIVVGHQLVRSGPYRVLRHPIYTAMIGMFAGSAVVSGEVHALIAVLMITYAYWRKIRMEETALLTQFGEEYEQYQKKTWALVPGIV
jgi:protein-S-isoprenylcysteine O-methyltransferase Ste14